MEMEKRQLFLRSYQFCRKKSVAERIKGSFFRVSKDDALKMYSSMVTLQTMDNIFYEAQRQERMSFYLTSYGEDAINIASAAALTQDNIILLEIRMMDSEMEGE
ncbi:hypothetical protein LOK49_LG02G00147 [Camellia lanceoleosa]|uniref:Uncharacterized protein n=1 Tax=Camellia lanceoleosa TaxID=1840588 RepID=A0ACC0IT47_9ERIC|nr:hypothetical protein LOK49_LG02G00147 [Camellia lanceoleosa]